MRRQTCPTNPSDYKPISITPVLPQLAEKIVVKHWLRPALLVELLKDQFAFRPSGSTNSALVNFNHHTTHIMLEENLYVLCLLIDFSKAFDIVCHSVLLPKLA